MKQLNFFSDAERPSAAADFSHYRERQRLEDKYAPIIREELRLGQLVSYVGNKKLPILRLYRYKEAFSFDFVKEFIQRFGLTEDDYLFDPFCGMGTTLFTAMHYKVRAIGIDKLPIATFISQTLPRLGLVEPQSLQDTFRSLQANVGKASPAEVALDVKIMKNAFPEERLLELRRWKSAIDNLSFPMRDIFALLFLAILEPCSYTAKDGQFLRLKRNKRLANPAEILQKKVNDAQEDIRSLRRLWGEKTPSKLLNVELGDCRDLSRVNFAKPPTAIITSPPYANRYDYTRTYALELCFNFVKNLEELKALRFGVLRSHIEAKVEKSENPPHPAIAEVVNLLRQQRKSLNNPRIPDMLIGYFVDMRQAIAEWSRVLATGARVALNVDNVRFAGQMVPVDLILSEMAEEFGFQVNEITIARYKGNSAQQMGKYGRVPVRESIVIWKK